MRAALSASGGSADPSSQIQYLEQENARLRAESQSLRAQLGSVSTSPTSAVNYGTLPSYSTAPSGSDSSGVRLPSVADAMVHPLDHRLPDVFCELRQPSIFLQNLRSASSTSYAHSSANYVADDASRSKYYESNSDYRRRISQPYVVPRRDSAPAGSYDKGYDGERIANSGSTSRSSQRSYQVSHTTQYPYSERAVQCTPLPNAF